MGKKLTTTEFIYKAKNIHYNRYDYSKTEYINTHTKVCIICPEHGEFLQEPANHLSGQKCPKCASIEVHNNQSNGKDGFIKKSKIVHGDKYDYSKVEYLNNHTKVCIICPEHGEFWQKPISHTQGKGCPYCGGTKKLTTEEFIVRANIIHGNKYDYSKAEYINTRKQVCIICPEHGEFWQIPHEHIGEQKQGCPYCGGTKKLTTEEFIEKANIIHGNKYDYSKTTYINTDTKVCIICPEHGEFWQTPHNHISSRQGCPNCNILKNSKIVQKIESKLNELNIVFEKEKTFDWLINKSNMYIDFYLPEYNVGIECHGIQHFEPIDFFGGIEEYNNRKNRDLLKYKLCSDHDIKIYYFTEIDSEYFDKIYCDENALIKDICKVKQK